MLFVSDSKQLIENYSLSKTLENIEVSTILNFKLTFQSLIFMSNKETIFCFLLDCPLYVC